LKVIILELVQNSGITGNMQGNSEQNALWLSLAEKKRVFFRPHVLPSGTNCWLTTIPKKRVTSPFSSIRSGLRGYAADPTIMKLINRNKPWTMNRRYEKRVDTPENKNNVPKVARSLRPWPSRTTNTC
jgi:hypothetical protein